MKPVSVKQYINLHQSLVREQAVLEARLAEICEALNISPASTATPVATPPARRGVKRIKNPVSLRAAVLRVTANKALTKAEILAAVQKLGYQFAASNPLNSLNTLLYTKGLFQKADGKFMAVKQG